MGSSFSWDGFAEDKFSREFPELSEGDLRLEVLREDHLEALWEVTPEDTFDLFTIRPSEWVRSAFDEYMLGLAGRGFFGLVVFVDGEVAGMSTFMDIRAAHCGLEIGHTFLAPRWRGTWVNPAMKRLMIGWAIDDLGAHRVQLKTDGRNFQSQKAMRNCGFVYEGVLRQHLVMPDGFVRDTVMFSVIRSDWERVKGRLVELETSRRG